MINNINEWKKFNLIKIFNFEKSNSVIINSINCTNKGKIPIVSSTSLDNGIKNFTNEIINKKMFKKNKITIAHNGTVGEIFYQDSNFLKTADITVLYNENLNKYNAMFFIPIMKINIKKMYSYGRKLNTKRLNEINIKLPIKRDLNKNPIIDNSKKYSNEGYIPDFEFMENYVKKLLNKFPKIEKIKKSKEENNFWKIDIKTWKNFKINNIFNTNEKGKITNSNNLDVGDNYYYVGAKKNENGYMKGIKLEYENLLTRGNCIGWIRQGVGSSGYSTYQDRDFYLASTVQVLRNNLFNKFHYLFFIPILDLEFPKYNFGRALSKKNIDNTIIKLPIKRDLNKNPIIDNSKKYSNEGYIPDFEFMENYIKTLKYTKYL